MKYFSKRIENVALSRVTHIIVTVTITFYVVQIVVDDFEEIFSFNTTRPDRM